MSSKETFLIVYPAIAYLSDIAGVPYTNDNNPFFEMFMQIVNFQNEVAEAVRKVSDEEWYLFARSTLLSLIPEEYDYLFETEEMYNTMTEIGNYYNTVMQTSTV